MKKIMKTAKRKYVRKQVVPVAQPPQHILSDSYYLSIAKNENTQGGIGLYGPLMDNILNKHEGVYVFHNLENFAESVKDKIILYMQTEINQGTTSFSINLSILK